MRGCSIEAVTALAMRFRDGIEACDKAQWPDTMRSFPAGACEVTSALLLRFLRAHGEDGFRQTVYVGDDCEHVWLARGRLVADITADQFPWCDRRVIVSKESCWHNERAPHVHDGGPDPEARWDYSARASLDAAYQAIARACGRLAAAGSPQDRGVTLTEKDADCVKNEAASVPSND